MKPNTWYRIAAVLLGLFAVILQVGFSQVDPTWGAGAVAAAMKTVQFNVMGFNRPYWDFFSGFGFFATVFLVFSAYLAFEFVRMGNETLAALKQVRWAFASVCVVIAALMFTNVFAAPPVISVLIAVALVDAAASRPCAGARSE